MSRRGRFDPLALFHAPVREWFATAFGQPTRSQALGWPVIARGRSSLILAPTGSGKTLAAFLWCLDRLMFSPPPVRERRCRVLYVSPLKALAVDVERNLRVPLEGIARTAGSLGRPYTTPEVAIRTGDTPAAARARFQREPADILITTPESLYLLLTSNARDALRGVDTVIIDEIHALVPTKRGAHLAVSLERLAARCDQPPQRIGLSATQRPLDEVARFLGGAMAANGRRTSHVVGRQSVTSRRPQVEIESEFSGRQGAVRYRPVSIVDSGQTKALSLRIEVPVEDMARPEAGGAAQPSIWAAIHPRLVELIRAHRSTLLFVNSRRLAERLAGAINELAGETLARSHHGSIAREQRVEIEELLKAGGLRALVATSSLELGIDMGAIDLVIQIEAPPSVASGLQRIGRGGHRIDAVSEGIIFPKYRGDLLASAAVAKAMHDGAVEATRYPRNPLDIVAQQIVAMAAMDRWDEDELFATLRSAAPFAELGREAFEGVLDMLSGRYPSDEFAELRPRITWDRRGRTVTAREGAKRVAIVNGGTIPDRGLYGVYLLGAPPGAARVGELDEEMVFETPVGQTFVLGASAWRVAEITHDRVLVTPAPGEPAKMPFWKGDRSGRPLELGLAIGRLTYDLLHMPHAAAMHLLTREHDLDEGAAHNLLQYLNDQRAAAGHVPDASTIVIERVRDELGDWRVCVLSPRGGRVHAPWAMAASARIREATGVDVDTIWGDEGFVVRFPDVDRPPDPSLMLPDPDDVQALVVRQLGATALFAGKFRENAARSLLLPKRRPGMRAPLWQQRKRAADLLAVASRFGSFPVLLETYRECLRDFFDMPALVATLADIRSRKVRVATVDSEHPSPFAASLLFSWVASFLYDGDAPLAERRAQALAVDQAQLKDLIGDAELRELLDAEAIDAVGRELQRVDERYRARSADGVHDMLLAIGDLTQDEALARILTIEAAESLPSLVSAGRIALLRIAGELRYVATEDAARYRDALGAAVPPGLPASLLEPVRDPLGDLALRYARTHAPFSAHELASRYELPTERAHDVLARLTAENRLLEGEFRPGGAGREWTDAGVLRMIRRRSLARVRKEIEPVEHAVLGRFATTWQGVATRRRGADALLDAVQQLQGAALPASILETEILPARIDQYDAADLDALVAAGEIVWVGVERLGEGDGRVALYLADDLVRLMPPQPRRAGPADPTTRRAGPSTFARGFGGPPKLASASGGRLDPPVRGEDLSSNDREGPILEYLDVHGASFFAPLHEAVGGGYPAETVNALWSLVWQGRVTNDTLQALRAFTRIAAGRRRAKPARRPAFRSRRLVPPAGEGRWSLVGRALSSPPLDAPPKKVAAASGSRGTTEWAAAISKQLLARHGVLTREAVAAESIPGGFGLVYPVLKAMEEAGRIRRGYFVAGLGATQFALPGALDLLRSLRVPSGDERAVMLAAADPANPYGATLPWPAFAAPAASAWQARTSGTAAASAGHARPSSASAASAGRGPTRTVGATVILVDGALCAYLARGDRSLLTWLPDAEPARSNAAREVARVLVDRARSRIAEPGGETSGDDTPEGSPRGMLIEEIDGAPPALHPLAPALVAAGFLPGALGFRANLES
ncbi:MAG: DEAD/DEAH box helicase [Acidobacteria bacterium RIFCSPLOWO2_02_FULL_65_29]|nr:MAG: DEAD/DEAH box helicase [Acidobacteria bacterium RIFCSPLOWO2_02_FULL_65_29]